MKLSHPHLSSPLVICAMFALTCFALPAWAEDLAGIPACELNGVTQEWGADSHLQPAPKADGNKVSLSNGTMAVSSACIYGAYTTDPSVSISNNTVTISNVSNLYMIYGGYCNKTTSTAGSTNNTIILQGEISFSNVSDGNVISGGYSWNGDSVTGNRLVLDDFHCSDTVRINKFQYIDISVSAWDASAGAILSLGVSVLPDTFTLTFNPGSWEDSKTGEQMTLISGLSEQYVADTTSWTIAGDAADIFRLDTIQNGDKYDVVVTCINGTSAIPEPATATLSLLALAGLAARRRRK